MIQACVLRRNTKPGGPVHIWCYILFLLFCGSHSEWMVWHYIALWHVDGSSLSRHQTHNIVIFSRICS